MGVEESFQLLEDRIQRAAERLKELQSENESLKAGLEEAQGRADGAEKELERLAGEQGESAAASKKAESLAREVKALKKEREEVRARIERLVELLETLD
jgi:predicted RNase H-like nuclease (RuvC/YqgF family)